jgi:cyanophycinase
MASGGALVIAGGAVRVRNTELFSRFAELARRKGDGIAVVTAATGKPADALARVRESLSLAAGTPPGAVIEARLEGGSAALEGIGGIWIAGGDQNRLVDAYMPGGRETPALRLMRDFLASGGTIGGTSAGAAAMCDPMIGEGTSLGALTGPAYYGYDEWAEKGASDDALLLAPGFGFLESHLIDQHFDARGRLGRVAVAALELGSRRGTVPLGFGIAEDSALVFDAGSGGMLAVGAVGFTVVDASRARRGKKEGMLAISDLVIHHVAPGDSFDPISRRVNVRDRLSIVGAEALSQARPVASGPLSAHAGLVDFVSKSLMDNAPENLEPVEDGCLAARGYLMGSPDAERGSRGYEITFRRKPGESLAWYGDDAYSFSSVFVDLAPIRIDVRRIG